jgi:hypothetical protein
MPFQNVIEGQIFYSACMWGYLVYRVPTTFPLVLVQLVKLKPLTN